MRVDLQQVINSSLSLRFVSVLAQRLSPQLGHRIAYYVAEQIARRPNSQVVRAVRANQWVISEESLDKEELDLAVCETLRHSARCIFDLYHYIQDTDATRQLIVLDPLSQQLAQRQEIRNESYSCFSRIVPTSTQTSTAGRDSVDRN